MSPFLKNLFRTWFLLECKKKLGRQPTRCFLLAIPLAFHRPEKPSESQGVARAAWLMIHLSRSFWWPFTWQPTWRASMYSTYSLYMYDTLRYLYYVSKLLRNFTVKRIPTSQKGVMATRGKSKMTPSKWDVCYDWSYSPMSCCLHFHVKFTIYWPLAIWPMERWTTCLNNGRERMRWWCHTSCPAKKKRVESWNI